jgi:hypothetical protein
MLHPLVRSHDSHALSVPLSVIMSSFGHLGIEAAANIESIDADQCDNQLPSYSFHRWADKAECPDRLEADRRFK